MDFCPLCNSNNLKIQYRLGLDTPLPELSYFSILKCNNCNLVFSNLLDHPAPIDSGYEDDYFSKYDLSFKDNPKIRTFRQALVILDKIKPKQGTLLDFGCAEGNFLMLAKQKGWNVYGLDLSQFATNIARKRGLDVLNTTIHNAKFKNESFDVITLWDVIEHLSNADEIFKEFRRVLKKGGLLIIRTPNEKSIFHQIARLSYILSFKSIKSLLKSIYHTDHLYYFSKQTLALLLRKNGFEIKKIIMNDQTMMSYTNPILKSIIFAIRTVGIILGKQHAMLAVAAKK